MTFNEYPLKHAIWISKIFNPQKGEKFNWNSIKIHLMNIITTVLSSIVICTFSAHDEEIFFSHAVMKWQLFEIFMKFQNWKHGERSAQRLVYLFKACQSHFHHSGNSDQCRCRNYILGDFINFIAHRKWINVSWMSLKTSECKTCRHIFCLRDFFWHNRQRAWRNFCWLSLENHWGKTCWFRTKRNEEGR